MKRVEFAGYSTVAVTLALAVCGIWLDTRFWATAIVVFLAGVATWFTMGWSEGRW